MIQFWPNRCPTFLARLIIDSCIISLARVFSYSDGYLLTGPDTGWTCGIATRESTHDVRVVAVLTSSAIVFIVEFEKKVVLVEKAGHVGVQ